MTGGSARVALTPGEGNSSNSPRRRLLGWTPTRRGRRTLSRSISSSRCNTVRTARSKFEMADVRFTSVRRDLLGDFHGQARQDGARRRRHRRWPLGLHTAVSGNDPASCMDRIERLSTIVKPAAPAPPSASRASPAVKICFKSPSRKAANHDPHHRQASVTGREVEECGVLAPTGKRHLAAG